MSSSEGWLVQDKLQFPDNGSSIDFVFGCENKETGAIFKQQVDGVLGMGNNENSFPRQVGVQSLAIHSCRHWCCHWCTGAERLCSSSSHSSSWL
jgi:hypothetical protein